MEQFVDRESFNEAVLREMAASATIRALKADIKAKKLEKELHDARSACIAKDCELDNALAIIESLKAKRRDLQAQLEENQRDYNAEEARYLTEAHDLANDLARERLRTKQFERLLDIVGRAMRGATIEEMKDLTLGDLMFAQECGLVPFPEEDGTAPETLREGDAD